MNTTILFVDDEPLILQALQRTLRPMRHKWDMLFVESGAKALELLSTSPVDVVVSDMLMPGMNGAQLLAEVMKRFPQTIRIILSGHADKELILQCVGSTHQYLSKPCEPDALRAVIQRATSLEASLETERVKELVASMGELPTVPALYSQIVTALNDPDTTVGAVGQIVEQDPAMTAKLLKLVNSAYFGLRRQVASAAEAASYLGVDTIKSLVLATGTFDHYSLAKLDGFSLEVLWNHSLQTAACARLIAQSEGAGQTIADESFVAGMLHDVGRLILACNFADRYGKVFAKAVSTRSELITIERDVFGTTHAAVGGYLLGLWGLPVPVVEAIALHHSPEATLENTFTALTAVHVGNVVVKDQYGGGDWSVPTSLVSLPYLASISLEDRLTRWRQEYANHSQLAATV